MAGETESEKPAELSGPPSPLMARLMTREVAISLAFALVTFAVYWFLGPKDTAYSYQVSQANNIIHGHLDMRPEDSKNLSVLERVLYDGHRFCLPVGDEAKLPTITSYADAVASGVSPDVAKAALISPTCKLYMQHSLGPALVVMPGVLIWGKDLNQVLVSAVIGALTAVVVFAIARGLTKNLLAQLALTVLMMFGTVFWWSAANGGVWMFAHTMAVFFLFGAIYFTLVRRSPLAAGALLGAAFMCRPTVIVSGLFFVIMFSDLWLRPRLEGQSLLKRIDLRPAVQFATGIAPFLLLNGALNFVRYGNPTEFGYSYVESAHQVYLSGAYNHGLTLSYHYITRHPPAILGAMPVFQKAAPYVMPSYFALAMWVTTPAFFYAFFPNIKKYTAAVIVAVVVLALACAFMMSRAIAGAWQTDWATQHLPMGVQYLPFWVMTAVAIAAGIYFRDKLTTACWAAIIPTVLVLFSFAFVGYAQFGYRYSLDFMPFLWLLVAHAVGDKMKWHHWVLIGMSVAVNLWGVLWIYQFQAHGSFGVIKWVTF